MDGENSIVNVSYAIGSDDIDQLYIDNGSGESNKKDKLVSIDVGGNQVQLKYQDLIAALHNENKNENNDTTVVYAGEMIQ